MPEASMQEAANITDCLLCCEQRAMARPTHIRRGVREQHAERRCAHGDEVFVQTRFGELDADKAVAPEQRQATDGTRLQCLTWPECARMGGHGPGQLSDGTHRWPPSRAACVGTFSHTGVAWSYLAPSSLFLYPMAFEVVPIHGTSRIGNCHYVYGPNHNLNPLLLGALFWKVTPSVIIAISSSTFGELVAAATSCPPDCLRNLRSSSTLAPATVCPPHIPE